MAVRKIGHGPYHRTIIDDVANTWRLQFYDSVAATWKDIMVYDTDAQTISLDPRISKSIPAIRLSGTETGAKDLSLRENAGKVELYDNAAAAVPLDWLLNPLLSYTELKADTIQLIVDIPILGDAAGGTVAADAIAIVNFAHTTCVLSAEAIKHLKSASIILDYKWAATADGYLELYDVTGAAVRATSVLLVGAEASEWLSLAATGLVAGNTHVVRANVTVAGAAAEVSTLFRAILRITLGVS